MKRIPGSVLMALLITSSALVSDSALAQEGAKGCDITVDIADIESRNTPFAMSVEQSLCLDSRQIETWFIDQGGWTNALTEDNRYWRLTPPGPTTATFRLMLPSGEQRELEVTVDAADEME